jgi:hypothetical protein
MEVPRRNLVVSLARSGNRPESIAVVERQSAQRPTSCSWLLVAPLPDSMNFVFAFAYVSFVSIVAESFL